MPKGVEHEDTALLTLLVSPVPLAVMPKGVEHMEWMEYDRGDPTVPLAVMPKGVEHTSVTTSGIDCGSFPWP